jgi:light-regulated signal transduction histidine kinase (bacteriophytochrome)
MVNLLEQIRAALDELKPRLSDRVVDIEMARLFVVADQDPLRRVLVALIDRGVDQYEGHLTVRTTKRRNEARIEVTGERRRLVPTAVDWPEPVRKAVAAIDGTLETEGPVGLLTVPLTGNNAPE